MTYVETRGNVWEALAGRAPSEPAGPVDPGLWGAVVDRLNPARARPALRAGIEAVQLTSVRGTYYILLRSPEDGDRAGYLRLTPEEWELALLMDGEHTVARLVAEFARIAGRLAPDQVRRVVADLAGNRMLDELPMDAFRPLLQARRKPLPERAANSVLAAARGRRMLVFQVDGLISALHRAGGRFFFGTAGMIVSALLAVAGLALFVATWSRGSRSLFLAGDSYLTGALVLVLLNIGVLVTHQLARALAAKQAGREVPAGGLLVYFGIPSLFVDTSDVWMAGRRARMLVAAAGPASALLLAGVAQLAGLALPVLGGITFKLAFLFYLNVFFRLSPLLPLDGHYLLMDWLEIPHLRARALAWVRGRLRGRPPGWAVLDREGKLIGLYGILCLVWLAVAANLVFLVWTDRVAGLGTGLWYSGPFGVLLFLLIVLGVAAPAVYFLLARLSRWWSDSRERRSEGDREADSPRRLAALLASDLGGLPEPALQGLAARARWVHPPTGTQIVAAGGSQSAVYVVVEGALAGRKPGDPPGTIRHHVGPGGVVGLVNALTGRSTQLDWHTAGTSLLSLTAATVATVVGPLPGPPPLDRAEAEALFADTPALAGLAVDQRLALIASAHPVDLDPGTPVILPGPTHAIVVESGVIALPDGIELRRGTLVGPVGDGSPGEVAQTVTPTRLWVLPDASDLPPLVGATHRPGSPMPVVSVNGGLRPSTPSGGGYPPLTVPPGPPDGIGDPEVDRGFERRLWWLIGFLLVFALVLTGLNFRAGPAWAEMPGDDALLTVDQGQVTAMLDGDRVPLESGDRRYVSTGAQIEVPDQAGARLTFPGGAIALICAGTRIQVGALATGAGRDQSPAAALSLQSGRLLADTRTASGAYQPLALTVARDGGLARNNGAAWFSVEPSALTVSTGSVLVDGTPSPTSEAPLACADGVPVAPPVESSADPQITEEPLPTAPASVPPSIVPSASVSPTATVGSPVETPDPDPVETDDEAPIVVPTRTVTTRPATRPPTPTRTPPRTTPPPTTQAPVTTPPPDPEPTTAPTTPPQEASSSSG